MFESSRSLDSRGDDSRIEHGAYRWRARPRGIASGVNNAVTRTASLIAIAVLGVVMLHMFKSNLDRRLLSANLPSSVAQSVQTQSSKLAAIEIPGNLNPGIQQLIRRAIDESFVSGFRLLMVIGAALAAASAVTAVVWIEATPRERCRLAEQSG